MKEFIKVGKNYMIKGSNGFIVSEEQKAQYEKNLRDPEHKPCNCGKKETEGNIKFGKEHLVFPYAKVKLNKKSTSKKIEVQNDTIQETNTTEE